MKRIKMLIMDVDGTLTDGKIYLSSSGEEIKAFNVKDGYAIKHILTELQIIPVIITGRRSKILDIRAKELDINEIYQGSDNKLDIYNKLKIKYNVNDENIAFIGDDFNDIPLFMKCGFTACPKDSVSEVKKISRIVLTSKGGEGAVQEYILHIYENICEKNYRS